MKSPVDPAELPEASANDHPEQHMLEAYCPHCEHAVDAACPICKRHVEASGASTRGPAGSSLTPEEFYRRIVLMLQHARNTKFALVCYLIATGDGFADGVSMLDVAKEWGVGKAAVSKQCNFICAYLQIPPSRYMRKASAKESYRQNNRRPQKIS